MKTVKFSIAMMAFSVFASPAMAGGPVLTKAAVGYDWLQPKKSSGATKKLSVAERRRQAARIAFHGRGSYICSPSGSGVKARCFSR